MHTSPIGRWAGVAAILPSRRAAKLNMMSGPGAGGSPWKKWSVPARARAWRVARLINPDQVIANWPDAKPHMTGAGWPAQEQHGVPCHHPMPRHDQPTAKEPS
jgi:hypothetical protein